LCTHKPAAAIDPTLDAALVAIAQATARAQVQQMAQRATAAAVSAQATSQVVIAQATARALSAEATHQAQSVQATAQAQNAQATQSAIDELTQQRAMTATAQAQNAQATRIAQEAMATIQAMNAQATATSQAVAIAAQATDTARLSATYATRQDRFTWGLLLVEILFVCGAAWVLWKLSGTLAAWAVKMRPQIEPVLSDVLASEMAGMVIEQPAEPEQRMPSTVQVFDDPRMVEALDRWAERYDAEHATLPRAGRRGDNDNQ